jgi:outer membrane protein assembly factor BamB
MTWKTVLESRGTQGKPLWDKRFVYVPTADNGMPKKCGVYKLECRGGGIVWKCCTENSVNSDPVDAKDRVMAVDCEANVYFIYKESGEIASKISLPHKGLFADVTVVADGDKAFVTVDGALFVIDLPTASVVCDKCTETFLKKPDICGKLLVGVNSEGMFALCKKTGDKAWINTDIRPAASPLLLVSGRIFIAAGDTLFVINGEDGTILGGKRVAGADFDVPSQPLLRGKLIYVGTKKGVVAIDVSDIINAEEASPVSEATPEETYLEQDGKRVVSDIICVDSHLIFTTADGYMYMVHIYTKSLKKNLCTLSSIKAGPTFTRMVKIGKTTMEAYIVTSSCGNKIFGNRLS